MITSIKLINIINIIYTDNVNILLQSTIHTINQIDTLKSNQTNNCIFKQYSKKFRIYIIYTYEYKSRSLWPRVSRDKFSRYVSSQRFSDIAVISCLQKRSGNSIPRNKNGQSCIYPNTGVAGTRDSL